AEGEPALDAGVSVLPFVQEEEELTVEVPVGDATGLERAALEGVLERDAGDAAEAEARLDRPLDRLGLAQRERHLQPRQQAVHRPIERLPRSGPALAQDPRGRQQISVGEGTFARERVARAA